MTNQATYVYQIPPGEKTHLLHLIAGKTKQQAVTTLFQLPGIQGAVIATKGNTTTLPDNPNRITIIVVYQG